MSAAPPLQSALLICLSVWRESDPFFHWPVRFSTVRQEQWPKTVNYHQLQAKVALVHYGLCVTRSPGSRMTAVPLCLFLHLPPEHHIHALFLPPSRHILYLPGLINTRLYLNKLAAAFCALPFHLILLYLAGKGLMDWSPEVSVESLWAWQRWWGHSQLRNNKWFAAHSKDSAGLLWIHYLY